jgi:hypothetical protein
MAALKLDHQTNGNIAFACETLINCILLYYDISHIKPESLYLYYQNKKATDMVAAESLMCTVIDIRYIS